MQMWRGEWHVGPGLLGFGLGHAKPNRPAWMCDCVQLKFHMHLATTTTATATRCQHINLTL